MIRLTVEVRTDNVIGVKETIRDYIEKYGDTRIVKVELIGESRKNEQLTLRDAVRGSSAAGKQN